MPAEHHLTVYFDTSFYVWLQRAGEREAERAISRLRDLGIRRVESGELFLELSVSPNLEGRQRLVQRLSAWSIPPLRLGPLTFELLAVEGADSSERLTRLHEMRANVADAQAWSVSAVQPLGPADKDLFTGILKEQFGFEVDLEDLRSGLAFMRQGLSNASSTPGLPPSVCVIFGEVMEKIQEFEDGNLTESRLRVMLQTFAERTFAALDAIAPGVVRESRQRSTVLAADTRGRDIAFERASPKATQSFRSSLSDLEHLFNFDRNTHRIDLLMMDRRQLATVEQRLPDKVASFRDRIFCARDIDDTIGFLEERLAASAEAAGK